jgi:hypothetical protein
MGHQVAVDVGEGVWLPFSTGPFGLIKVLYPQDRPAADLLGKPERSFREIGGSALPGHVRMRSRNPP